MADACSPSTSVAWHRNDRLLSAMFFNHFRFAYRDFSVQLIHILLAKPSMLCVEVYGLDCEFRELLKKHMRKHLHYPKNRCSLIPYSFV